MIGFFILHTLSCNCVAAGISIVVAVDCLSFTLAIFFILIDLWLATRVLHQWHSTRGGSWSVGALPCHRQVWGRGQYNTQTYSPFIDSFLPYSSCMSLLAFKFYNVKIFCVLQNPADKDNIGPIEYYPQGGFHFKYFPFRNQQAYRSPLVMARFIRPHPGVLVMVQCKAYARNIRHNQLEKAGMVHFELMVD